MTLDLFLISVSIALLVLSSVLVVLLALMIRGLARLKTLPMELQREIAPLVQDVRSASMNVAEVADSLRAGMQRINRMTEAVGAIGDDLEEGRQSVQSGVQRVKELLGPWLARFKA